MNSEIIDSKDQTVTLANGSVLRPRPRLVQEDDRSPSTDP